jgi:hypothetical protein
VVQRDLVGLGTEPIAGEQLVEDRARAEQIDLRRLRAPGEVLGRHVPQLALDVDAGRLLGGQPRDAEVGELHLARQAHEHVVRGDVAVDDAELMT